MLIAKKGRIEIWGFTEKGPCEENQDSFGFCASKNHPNKVIVVVCDGTPGEKSGKKAAEYIVKGLVNEANMSFVSTEKWVCLIEKINVELIENEEVGCSTLAFLELTLEQNQIKINCINIGDSRIFVLYNKRQVELLTIDDRSEVYGTELTEVMGVNKENFSLHVKSILLPCESEAEIAFCLCTDGFYEVVDRTDTKEVFEKYGQMRGQAKHINLRKLFFMKEKLIEDNATLVTVIINAEEGTNYAKNESNRF